METKYEIFIIIITIIVLCDIFTHLNILYYKLFIIVNKKYYNNYIIRFVSILKTHISTLKMHSTGIRLAKHAGSWYPSQSIYLCL